MKHKPQKREIRIKRALGWLILLLCVSLLVSLGFLIRTLLTYRADAKAYEALSALAVRTEAPQLQTTAEPLPPESAPTPEPAPSELPITVDWEALRAVNGEIAGWLYCEGTPINYPIVQTDNNEAYLKRSFAGDPNAAGTLFFDHRNTVIEEGQNILVYGHRMKDDSMFGSLTEYPEEDYLLKHPILYLLTPAQGYRVEVFACRTVRADTKYFPIVLADRGAYDSYAAKAVAQSYWRTEVRPEDGVALLTLVTCSNYAGFDDPRLLVHGSLIPVD